MTETQGGVKRHHPEPLLHRTVRLAVLHTGRGDCSPHKITAKSSLLIYVPLSAVLAPRRTPQSVLPATHHSARAPLLRFLCEDGAFPALFLLFLRRPPSYPATGGHHRDRLARPSTPTCPEGSTASGGTAQRRTTALQSATTSASRRRQPWPACSSLLVRYSTTTMPPRRAIAGALRFA